MRFVVTQPDWFVAEAAHRRQKYQEVEADDVAEVYEGIDVNGGRYTVILMWEQGLTVIADQPVESIRYLVEMCKTDPATEIEDKVEVGVFVGAIALALVAGTAAAFWIAKKSVRVLAGK